MTKKKTKPKPPGKKRGHTGGRPNGKLTDQQRLFCQEYMKDLSISKAALRAGYSKDNPDTVGCDLLRKPWVTDYIRKLQKQRANRLQIVSDRVLEELLKVAFSDMKQFAKWGKSGVTLNDSKVADGSVVKCVSEKTGKVNEQKIELWDKIKALEMVGRHIGFFEADNDQLSQIGKQIKVVLKDGTQKDAERLQAQLDALD